jgi:transmembrane sensor
MQSADAKKLFEKYQSGTCSPEEKAIVENWLTFGDATDLDLSEEELDQDLSELKYKVSKIPVKKTVLWPKIAMTAAAVAAVVFGVWFYTSRHPDTSSSRTAGRDLLNDIAPGKNGATITLGNGQVIQLNGQKKGVVIGDNEIRYNDNTSVSQGSTSSRGNERSLDPANTRYLSQGRDDGRMQLLTASTSRGQTYQFTLPDGTKVWLNADSKLEFPSNFMNSKTRNVKLTGEAYFAVVHNTKQPFRVESNGQEVEDIGTEFNISAYSDEANIKTTLVEGSAQVYTPELNTGLNSQKVPRMRFILKPNEQSVLSGGQLKVKTIDPEDAISWKSGYFSFYNEPIKGVMQKIARWYDIEVVYEGQVPKDNFTGTASREKNISQVLHMLERTKGVHFKVEGRRVTVIE